MDRFLTLMKREWLQHRIGWTVLAALPVLIALGLSLMQTRGLHIELDGDELNAPPWEQLPVVVQTLGWTLATGAMALVFSGLSVLAQLSGLARRDVQDRSIEFWRSLPTGDGESIGALLLMHLLVLPFGAVCAAVIGAQVVALLGVSITQGPVAWLTQPWWLVLAVVAAALARLMLGMWLAVLWLSPLLLLTMAACAWAKRWGMPLVVVGTLAGVQGLDRWLSQPVVGPALERLFAESGRALLTQPPLRDAVIRSPGDLAQALPGLSGWLVSDGVQALGLAATPAFALALLGGATGFALLVWRRRRAA